MEIFLDVLKRSQDKSLAPTEVDTREAQSVHHQETKKYLTPETISVVCTKTNDDLALNYLRQIVRKVCIDEDFKEPYDVLTTKNKEVIVKVNTNKEAIDLQEALEIYDQFRQSATVRIPFRKGDRVLILSVDPRIEEQTVINAVERSLEMLHSGRKEKFNLLKKLSSLAVIKEPKILEDIQREQSDKCKVVKVYDTKFGKKNWLLDIEKDSSEALLKKGVFVLISSVSGWSGMCL